MDTLTKVLEISWAENLEHLNHNCNNLREDKLECVVNYTARIKVSYGSHYEALARQSEFA